MEDRVEDKIERKCLKFKMPKVPKIEKRNVSLFYLKSDKSGKPNHMEYGDISQKIKALRTKRKITIQDLSAKTSLTAGYLSKIENSGKPPPIPTLAKIAYALKVHVSYFFEEEGGANHRPSITKKNNRKEIIGDYTAFGYKYEAIIPRKEDGSIKPLIITLPNTKTSSEIPYNYHEGEEMIFVLEGKLNFYYGDDTYIVEEGDCLHFDSSVPHKVITAAGESERTKILSILSL